MSNKPSNPSITEQELDETNGVQLPREVRKEILLRFKKGETVAQICDLLQLKRHKVRAVVDPAYRNPHARTKKLVEETIKSEQGDETQTFRQRAVLNEANKPKEDSSATPDTCLDDLRDVAKRIYPKYPTRWDYYLEGKYHENIWRTWFGNFEQFAAGAGLRPTRYERQVERNIAKHSSLDERRRFYREEIQPYIQNYSKSPRKSEERLIISASDFHDEESDRFSLDVLVDTITRLKPDVVSLVGDIFDEYEFSRFDQDPRFINVASRREFVKQHIFRRIREAAPNAQIDLLLGNHEWRLLKHMADRTPNLKPLLDWMGLTIEDFFGVREFEINLYCKWDFSAYMKQDVKDQLRKNYIVYDDALVATHFPDPSFRYGRSWVAGHTHKPDQMTRRTLDGHLTGTTMGSIAKVDQLYISGFDQARNGFAIHHVFPRTRVVISENIQIMDDVAAVAGKYYHRV